MSYQDTETWDFGFEFKNEVKEPEAKFFLSHGNFSFWFL